MDPIDRDGPPDGDFAGYVERLTAGAGSAPGAEPATRAWRRAMRPATDTAGAARTGQSPGEVATAAAARAEAQRRKLGPADMATLRAAGRRATRWLAIAGVALIALAVLDVFPRMSPLPGIGLLALAMFLRRRLAR